MDAPLPAQDEALVAGFPLSNLPTEVILHIVRCLDERPSSSSFPPGPSVDLLALSACSTFFYATCRPLVWRSISFEADLGGMRPESWIERRSLKTLRDLMRESKVVIGARAGNDNELTTKTQLEDQRAFAPLPIKAFSYSYPRLPFHLSDDDLRPELEALLDVIILLRHSPTQVIFLKGAEVASKRLSAAILGALMQIETLSALRLNQMEFTGPLSFLPTAPALPHLRTLQIMHGAPKLVELVRLAPNLESLLMWPSARSYRDLGPDILQKLPHLRLLSLDAVHEPTLFGALTRKIESLAAQNVPLPLEELFLEGRQTTQALTSLISSLVHLPQLKRLALYHLRDARPGIVADLYDVAPQLEALTLVHGDTSRAVDWPADLEAYLPALSRFSKLAFFAWDRRSPISLGPEPLALSLSNATVLVPQPTAKQTLEAEYEALSALGRAVTSLKEAVAITVDVSEGSQGYFAKYERQGSQVRIHVQRNTAQDFLVGFERWCVIADD